MEMQKPVSDLSFVCYLDDKGEVVRGYFKIIKVDSFLLRLKTHRNILTIPMARVLVIKDTIKEVGEHDNKG